MQYKKTGTTHEQKDENLASQSKGPERKEAPDRQPLIHASTAHSDQLQ